MDANLLLMSSSDGGNDYLLFTANKLKEKRIFIANFSLEYFTDSQCKTMFTRLQDITDMLVVLYTNFHIFSTKF